MPDMPTLACKSCHLPCLPEYDGRIWQVAGCGGRVTKSENKKGKIMIRLSAIINGELGGLQWNEGTDMVYIL